MPANPKPKRNNKAFLAIDKRNDMAWDVCRSEPDKAIKLAEKSLSNSLDSGYEKGEAKAYHIIGAGKGWKSEFKEAEENVIQAIEMFNNLKEITELGLAYYSLGAINYYKGDVDKAKHFCNLSYESYVFTNDEYGKAMASNGMGSIQTLLNNYNKAWEHFEEGFSLSDKIGNDVLKARISEGMATLSRKEGDYKKAIKYYNQSLRIGKKSDNIDTHSHCLEGIGELYLLLGNIEKADSFFEKALSLFKETGFIVGEAKCMVGLASVCLRRNDKKRAEVLFKEALKLAKKADGKNVILEALENLSQLYKDSSKWKEHAQTLFEYYNLKEDLSSEKTLKEQNVKLEKAFDNTKILSEIGQEIIASLELDEVLFTIYNKVNQLMDASVFGIGIYHEEDKNIEYKLAIENGKKYKPYIRDTKDKSQLAVWCIDQKAPIFINDVNKEKKKFTKENEELWSADLEDGSQSMESEQSIMYVPILGGKEVIGLITVQSFDKNAYSLHHLDILKNIAVYSSIALINANVYKSLENRIQLSKKIEKQHSKLEKAYQNNKILSEIGQDITSSLSVIEVIQRVYKSINAIMDASIFALGLYNKNKNLLEFEGGMEKGKELPNYALELTDENRPAIYCFNKNKEVIIKDWRKDIKKYIKKSVPASAGELPESVIYLPLVSKDKKIGVITVQSFEKDAYSDYHIDILKNLAVYIPIALDNAVLYREMEKKVNERTGEIEQSYKNTKILNEIGQEINSSLSIKEIV